MNHKVPWEKKEHVLGKSKTHVFLILGQTEKEVDGQNWDGSRGGGGMGLRRMKKFLSD